MHFFQNHGANAIGKVDITSPFVLSNPSTGQPADGQSILFDLLNTNAPPKWPHGGLPMDRTCRNGASRNASCPHCNAPKEDALHVLKCPSAAATATWFTSLHSLESWMVSSRTIPDLCKTIITALWRDPTHPTPTPGPWISPAFHTQSNIGWWPFLQGHQALEWASAQTLTSNALDAPTPDKNGLPN